MAGGMHNMARTTTTGRARTAHDGVRSTTSVLIGGAVGNLIEWYDWTIYGLLSSIFASRID
jgi:hypothetical protein